MHLDAERTRAKRKKKREALKCKLVSPWYPCQFIPPVCQHCHPSVTWRQWWSCLSFGSCGLLSGANQLLCMQCGCPSIPCSRPVFILSRYIWLETISNGGVKGRGEHELFQLCLWAVLSSAYDNAIRPARSPEQLPRQVGSNTRAQIWKIPRNHWQCQQLETTPWDRKKGYQGDTSCIFTKQK